MITINVAQTLRETIGDPRCDGEIDRCIDEIERHFVKPDLQVVLETVGPDGEVIDHFDGRTLNPGHAIEAAWFILHEAAHRGGDPRLVGLGTRMLDWMWARGWDAEYGGLFYFRDLKGLPVQEYWHDMKFWWPHCEAIIATLLAYRLTGEPRYAAWHRLAHDWSFRHFADPEHGDWFGYLHRDGRLSVPLKGNLWKGPFHLPRMLLYSWRLLAGMQEPAGAAAEPSIPAGEKP
jgi:N-acylglucosamine 2-epimerase